ncbi:MAG: AAA family ATPase [Oscillospiraceae bacterium]|jgi:septum site-determining protein MinD|nr:AAA family ATPase [Oscillospiraceae bacterium]
MDTAGVKKIAFTSGKGGVGKSTLVSAIGQSLCEKGHKVLLVDCYMGLVSLDIMLSLNQTVYNWYDVISGACSPDKALTQGDGPYLLSAPQKRVDVTEQDMIDLIEKYENDFDFILIDSPAGIGHGFKLSLAMANDAIVVSTPDNVCARGVGAAVAGIYEAGLAPRLIINRLKKKGVKRNDLLNVDTVIDQTGARLIGVVFEDEKFSVAINKGQKPPDYLKASKAVGRITRRLQGEELCLKL